jgi:hypothetical protein
MKEEGQGLTKADPNIPTVVRAHGLEKNKDIMDNDNGFKGDKDDHPAVAFAASLLIAQRKKENRVSTVPSSCSSLFW